MLTCFFDETGIKGQDAVTFFSKGFINHLPIKSDKVKWLSKVARIGMLTQITIPTHIAKVDLPACDENRCKKGQQKFLLRFGYFYAIEYLYCQFHCAVSPDVGYL